MICLDSYLTDKNTIFLNGLIRICDYVNYPLLMLCNTHYWGLFKMYLCQARFAGVVFVWNHQLFHNYIMGKPLVVKYFQIQKS